MVIGKTLEFRARSVVPASVPFSTGSRGVEFSFPHLGIRPCPVRVCVCSRRLILVPRWVLSIMGRCICELWNGESGCTDCGYPGSCPFSEAVPEVRGLLLLSTVEAGGVGNAEPCGFLPSELDLTGTLPQSLSSGLSDTCTAAAFGGAVNPTRRVFTVS